MNGNRVSVSPGFDVASGMYNITIRGVETYTEYTEGIGIQTLEKTGMCTITVDVYHPIIVVGVK